MTSLHPDGYPELRARATLFEESGDPRPLCDPDAAERALRMAGAWRAHPDGADFDVVYTLATLLWQRHLFQRRTSGARRADGRAERRAALFLYAWTDAFLPALVPADVRTAVRRLPRLPRAFRRLRKDPGERPAALVRHGLAALNRHDRLLDRPTLRLGLTLMREAVDATPAGSPLAHTLGVDARCALGIGLQRVLDVTGDLRVLPEALAIGREAVQRCPDDHPERPLVFFNFGTLLLDSHLRAGDQDALGESLRVSLRALELTSATDPDRRERLAHVAHLHSLHYDRTRDPAHLRKAVAHGREAARGLRSGTPVRDGSLLHNLAKDLHTLYEAERDLQVLRESVSTQRRAVDATPKDSPKRSGRRHNLGVFLVDLAEATGDAATVHRAVALGRENLRQAPPGHPEHLNSLDTLYRALDLSVWELGLREGAADLLDTARRRVGAAGPDTSREAALVLAQTLKRVYDTTGELSTLLECGDVYRRLTDPAAAGNLSARREDPVGHLLALVDVLAVLYERRGDLDALDEAEQVARRALALAPASGTARAVALAKLGDVLEHAADRATDADTYLARVTEAIDHGMAAEAACPKDDERYPALLLQAGRACLDMYDRSGIAAALVNAKPYLEQAVHTLPLDAQNGAEARALLAELLLSRHRCTAEQERLLDAFPDDLPRAAALAGRHVRRCRHTTPAGRTASCGSWPVSSTNTPQRVESRRRPSRPRTSAGRSPR
ncbi:hypothetical protein ACIPUC_12355 [Streptomyces sp. LARHCF249]